VTATNQEKKITINTANAQIEVDELTSPFELILGAVAGQLSCACSFNVDLDERLVFCFRFFDNYRTESCR
jgi:hypothetical protein